MTTSERTRATTLGAVAFLAACLALALRSYQPHDWSIVATAGDALLHGRLRLYAVMPEAQEGPLALLLVGALPRALYVVLVVALLPALLATACRGVALGRTAVVCLGAGGALLALPWTLYALEGHADDALVALGAAVTVVALRERRDLWAAGGFAIALAAKPTAVVFLPLLLLRSRRLALGALTAGAVVWAPFVLADPAGFAHAGSGIALVQPHSLPDLLGSHPGAAFPPLVRPAQLFGGLALCWLVGRRAGAAQAVVAVVAFRAMLEPGAWPSYCTAVIAAAVVADLWRGRTAPTGTLLAFGAWLVSYTYPLTVAEGLLRLGLLSLVVLDACRTAGNAESRPASTRRGTGEAGRRLGAARV